MASTVITAYSAQHPHSTTAALGIHLIVYCAVGACLAFGLYALLQPSRAPNSGLAAYEPPPGVVVKYGKPSLATTVAEPIAPVEQPIAPAALIDPEPATTARSTPESELKPTIAAPPSQPRTAKRPNREVKIESPKRRSVPCIPGYDSSGAQTRPC
jgi:hypothetical protein